MALEKITGENLPEIRSGLTKRYSGDSDAFLNFVLIQSLDREVYLRIDKGPGHIDTLNHLKKDLIKEGEDINKYKTMGGGIVNVYHNEENDGKTHLFFSGGSDTLGKFDKNLLRQILEEYLDKEKFTYEI